MLEYVIVGGGIAAVTAAEDLAALLQQSSADSSSPAALDEQRRQRRAARRQRGDATPPVSAAVAAGTAAPAPIARVTLLHAGHVLQRVGSSVQRTRLVEEVTAVDSMNEEQTRQRIEAAIARAEGGIATVVQVRMIRGVLVGLEAGSKELLYTPDSDSSDISSTATSASPSRLHYDKLCLCTGSRPTLFVHPPAGQPLPPQVLAIRDAGSLARLSACLAEPLPSSQKGRAKHVVVVGNGGIAIELVHALRTGQMGTVNVSDAVATPAAAPSDSPSAVTAPVAPSPSPAALPPLSVSWVVKHPFLCNPFLDPMSSAFLLPELFPHADPPAPKEALRTDTATMTDNGTGGQGITEEERIAGLERGKHVHTIFHGAEEGTSDAAAAAAAAAASVSSSTSAAVPSTSAAAVAPMSAALGPNWLNKLDYDTNIPKYVVERERAAKAAAATSTSSFTASESHASDAAAPPPPSFDLSLHLCAEVRELDVAAGADAAFPLELQLTNGQRLGADLLVSATGVTPNTEWAPKELLLASDGGIVIDECMRTSLPDVYAAGDCASLRFSPAFLAQHASAARPLLFHQARLWSHAKLLGTYAARAMSGSFDRELQDLGGFNFMLFAHSTSLLGRKVILIGKHNLQGMGGPAEVRALVHSGALRTLVRCDPHDRHELIKIHLLHGRVIGALLVGSEESDAVELEETMENLAINQTDLTPFGDFLNDVNVDIADFFD